MPEQNPRRWAGHASPDEELARLLIESIDNYAIFMLDPSGRVESWNSGAERIKGYSAGEVLGRHFSLFYPPGEIIAGKCEYALRCATEQGRFTDEGWRLRKNGERFWASVTLTAMRDATGQLRGFAKITKDLTERRLAEEQLRRSEEQFRLLVSGVKDYAIFMLDTEGRVLTWNSGAQRIKGYEAREIIGQSLSRFYTDEAVALGRPWDLLGEAARHGRVEDEGWRVRKDGSLIWANVVITAVYDETGKLRGFAKVTRDLSERRKVEERLRRSEERFRLLVSSVRDYAIFMLDTDGRVMTWNEGAASITGYTAKEIVGEPVALLYPPEEVAKNKPALDIETAKREGRLEEEGWRLRKDGTTYQARVTLSPVYDATGALMGFAKVTRDLTESKRAEDERVRLAQAQEAIRMRDEFLSIASHELKTPLTALQLQLQSMRERLDAVEPKTHAKLERAVRSTERLSDLIEKLLDVSRLSSGQLTLHLERFDLLTAVNDVTERLREAATHASCEVRLQSGQPIEGDWDRLRIEQVLTNLLSNAFKYAAGSPIELSVSREGPDARLVVTDKGPGIPEKDLPRLFGRFERAASIRHYGGLGLGLYVSREIVEAHGGSISASNQPGGGACFTIRLPAVPPAQGETASRPE
ncbi:PAS domain-containing sensor histidine kinase [Archangium minus]|uniref:histidine kinase n=1 Tax=Archangium minus TaxID=83450 RepID=A0ABY9WJL6_9BACT|nr:PAS domain-containing sensor histidine kinase [Archangium minus]